MSDDDEDVIEAVAEAEAEAETDVETETEAEAEVEVAAEAEAPLKAADLADPQLKSLIEAVIFAADKPVTILRIRQLTRVSDMPRLARLLDEIQVDFQDRGIVLHQVSGGYQFRTATPYSVWVQQLVAGRPVRLSRAQLETLAIVAYRQPITRPEIDDIRGVDSGATLKLLLERSLIRVLGKKEEPGRPILYGTTRDFLDFFSLSDLRELPTLREYSELTPENQEAVRKLEVAAEPAEAAAPPPVEVDAVPAVVAAEGSGPNPAASIPGWS